MQQIHPAYLLLAFAAGLYIGIFVIALMQINGGDTTEYPMPRKKTTSELAEQVAAFKKYRIGESFFMPHVYPQDLTDFCTAAASSGVGVLCRRVLKDEIYQCAGTRVWRTEGACDREEL